MAASTSTPPRPPPPEMKNLVIRTTLHNGDTKRDMNKQAFGRTLYIGNTKRNMIKLTFGNLTGRFKNSWLVFFEHDDWTQKPAIRPVNMTT